MKKFIKRLKKLNNHGSSIVMVVVALGFIGIIIGALLSAAGYAYKLKLENKNSKNNFYYVEQAMQEIYAGVGAHTIEEMKDAYTYTVENMVRFDPNIGTYVTLDDDVANEMFKDKFMKNVIDSEFFAMGDKAMAEVLESYISNDTVKLDKEKVNLQVSADKIVIKDVTLTRMQEYDKSTAAGTYVQTISTDIVISEPDFSVRFNNMASDYSGIFKYALVGDMGIQIVNNTNLKINGNIYASADYYNKQYNMAGDDETVFSTKDGEGKIQYEYNLSPVTSKVPTDLTGTNGYVNRVADPATLKLLPFDGENTYSMNSGLYMSGSNVTLVADRVIVPGTVAVMDSSELTVFGTAGSVSEVWADNIVLGGSTKVTPVAAGDPSKGVKYEGATAIFGGNLYVRDDTEINAKGSEFVLHGSYYGYGNSTSKDTRTFVPTVDKDHFQITNGSSTENRGHYNSSSIVVNGENSTLDLSEAKQIYLAGRAYIELSKDVKGSSSEDGSVYSETFTYMPTYTDADEKTQFIRDYKTAESISVKSNQVMYNISSLGTKKRYSLTDDIEFDVISLSGKPNAQIVFGEFFPEIIFGNNVPCVEQIVDGKTVYLVDFETGFAILKRVSEDWSQADVGVEQWKAAREVLRSNEADEIRTVNDLSLAFAMRYYDFVSKNKDTELRDITAYDEFEAGNIIIPDNSGEIDFANMAQIYSSGAITTKSGNTFTMVTNNNTTAVNALLSDSDFKDNYIYNSSDNTYSDPGNAFIFSKDMEVEYNYLKWNLDHYNAASDEQAYVQSMIAEKGESITPIHKYLVMNKVTGVTNVTTTSGYKVIISDSDVVVKDGTTKSISGVIIAKGDVTFDENVESFEGMIVAGGKIYIGENLKSLNASPNVCRGVLRDCITTGDAVSLKILNVFKEYENYTADGSGSVSDDEEISIDAIDYTQVVSMTNWMKNVGGGYDEAETP